MTSPLERVFEMLHHKENDGAAIQVTDLPRLIQSTSSLRPCLCAGICRELSPHSVISSLNCPAGWL